MSKLIFEKVIYRNFKIVSRETLYVWTDVTPFSSRIICQNFYDGFCLALNENYRSSNANGFVINSWNLHKDGNGWQYRFVNGSHRIVTFKSKSK